jgi:hypothetical protein
MMLMAFCHVLVKTYLEEGMWLVAVASQTAKTWHFVASPPRREIYFAGWVDKMGRS